MNIFKSLTILSGMVILTLLSSCGEDNEPTTHKEKPSIGKKMAVVMPMEHGLDIHWKRCLDLYTSNLERAYKNQDLQIKLEFELYDESTVNLDSLAYALGRREDIYAVAGGLYSSDAAILTAGLSRVGKTFFTMATSEELIRAYASTGNLWALVETDITQSEVLLAKVANYGGESVALVAKEDDIYGKTFIDWFPFQARELGLRNTGLYSYGETSASAAMKSAVESGAEYIICAPSGIDEIGNLLSGYEETLKTPETTSPPRLLFSDTGYGADVLSLYGTRAEGIEGVAFGADPESGFDISYKTFFGVSPTTAEAQLYDALMLAGYAAWYQNLHPDASLQTALREIVSGNDINMGSWMAEDMSLVIDALANGASPCVRGASGSLRFDNKVFTNVLSTTYYNYRVYDGQYIILDYNTSDGSNRTDATLAGWNWKASQIQNFDDSVSITYPERTGNWALLVATSSGWTNYRHQADVMAIYRQLRKRGFPDDRIILIAEDDIGFNLLNPDPGVVRITPGGENVYENIEFDYRLSDLSPEDFLSILGGEKNDKLSKVVESGEGDNIFVFWSGHGVSGSLCWNDDLHGMTGDMLSGSIRQMASRKRFRKLLMMVEACYSGGVMEKCIGIPGILGVTAANGEETSKADFFNGELGVWTSNRFTSTFIEQVGLNPAISMRDLYYRLFLNTVGSHVMVYNASNFGSLYTSNIAEFIDY